MESKIMAGVVAVIVALIGLIIVSGIVSDAVDLGDVNDTLNFTGYNGSGAQALSQSVYSTFALKNNSVTLTADTHYTLNANNTVTAINTSETLPAGKIVLGTDYYATYKHANSTYITDSATRTVLSQSPILMAVVGLIVVAYMLARRED